MKNTLKTSWTESTDTTVVRGGTSGSRERFGVAPIASVHGTGLPFAGLMTADITRPDAYGIPRPRGPQR